MRGPASVAQTLYRETEESQEARAKVAAERKELGPFDVLRDSGETLKERSSFDSSVSWGLRLLVERGRHTPGAKALFHIEREIRRPKPEGLAYLGCIDIFTYAAMEGLLR